MSVYMNVAQKYPQHGRLVLELICYCVYLACEIMLVWKIMQSYMFSFCIFFGSLNVAGLCMLN